MYDNLQALCGLTFSRCAVPARADRVRDRLVVFQVEIDMSGGLEGDFADFAANPHEGEQGPLPCA